MCHDKKSSGFSCFFLQQAPHKNDVDGNGDDEDDNNDDDRGLSLAQFDHILILKSSIEPVIRFIQLIICTTRILFTGFLSDWDIAVYFYGGSTRLTVDPVSHN